MRLLERESWKHLDKDRLICPICHQSGVKWTNKGPSGSPSATGTRRFSIRCDGSLTGTPCGHSGRLVNILLQQQDSDYLDIGQQIASAHQQLEVLTRSEAAALRQPKTRTSNTPKRTIAPLSSNTIPSILSHFSPSPATTIPTSHNPTDHPSNPDSLYTDPSTLPSTLHQHSNLPSSLTSDTQSLTSQPSPLQNRFSEFSYNRSRDRLTTPSTLDTLQTMSSSSKKTVTSSSLSTSTPSSHIDQSHLLEQVSRMSNHAKEAEIRRLTDPSPIPAAAPIKPSIPAEPINAEIDMEEEDGEVFESIPATKLAAFKADLTKTVLEETPPQNTPPVWCFEAPTQEVQSWDHQLYMRGFAEPGPLRYTIIRNALLTLGISSGILDMSFIGKSVVHLLCDSSKAAFIQSRLTDKGVFLPAFNPLEVPELVVRTTNLKKNERWKGAAIIKAACLDGIDDDMAHEIRAQAQIFADERAQRDASRVFDGPTSTTAQHRPVAVPRSILKKRAADDTPTAAPTSSNRFQTLENEDDDQKPGYPPLTASLSAAFSLTVRPHHDLDTSMEPPQAGRANGEFS
ncbi:hypothetical protein BC829DRAFT_442191 [Chytridium lagenaria]|nr:hypothetical protein BC829DRAFT_442191 [Chytridium lagenaria]